MQLTTNTQAFIDAEVYSSMILTNLHDGLLGEAFYRDVSDFGSGTTLNIKTVGSVTLQELAEGVAPDYNPIESGSVTLTITEYVGDAWAVSDDLREDGSQIDSLMSARSMESTRAYQEVFETKFLEACNSAQTDADPNKVNGFAHRISSTATNNVFTLSDIILMRLAFNKANVPDAGRVLIVDPIGEATLDNLVTLTSDVTDFAVGVVKDSLASGMRLKINLYGFDVIMSNRLPTGTFSDGTTQVTNAVANIAMCIADDNCKPIMHAMRRPIKVEGERNKDLRQDEFTSSSRYGFGAQRVDTLGVYITSAINVQ